MCAAANGSETRSETTAKEIDYRRKHDLLIHGVQLHDTLLPGLKAPHRVRSGSCGGLDLVLPGGLMVNAPVSETFARTSRFHLNFAADQSASVHDDVTGESVPVEIPAAPDYYASMTCSTGRPMVKVGQICSDRLGVGLTNRCHFWSHKSERCKFCSIGLNADSGEEYRDKDATEILEVTSAAIDDPALPARHVLLGGGTPPGSDSGARRIAEVAEQIKLKHPSFPIYAMIVPPSDLRWISRLRQAGVDELGMNVELFSAEASAEYIPGKHKDIGLAGYLRALETSVGVFGPVNTRSIVLAGLEPARATVDGLATLASIGVMPILTPFRPLAGTIMENQARWTSDMMWRLALDATDAVGQHGIPMGPTCIDCQSNTLIVRRHELHRQY